MTQNKSVIYGIWCPPNALKIGKANYVNQRLANIQCANPVKLELLWTVPVLSEFVHEVEKRVHERLRKRRLQGEWFRFRRSLANIVDDLIVCEIMEDLYEQAEELHPGSVPGSDQAWPV